MGRIFYGVLWSFIRLQNHQDLMHTEGNNHLEHQQTILQGYMCKGQAGPWHTICSLRRRIPLYALISRPNIS